MIFGSFLEGIESLIYSCEKKHLRWKWSFPKKLEIIFFWEMVPNLRFILQKLCLVCRTGLGYRKFIYFPLPVLTEKSKTLLKLRVGKGPSINYVIKKVLSPSRPPPFGRAAAGCLRNERNIWPFTPVNVSCHSSWDYYSQCHWPRCVRRWAGNHSASDVNGSGVQSTQLGHGETLTFFILFLNLSFFSVLHCCKRDMQDGGILASTKISESSTQLKEILSNNVLGHRICVLFHQKPCLEVLEKNIWFKIETWSKIIKKSIFDILVNI